MTTPSRPSSATSKAHRNSFARFGTVGSMALWALTLAGAPFYVIIALVFGVSYSIIDRVRAAGRAGSDAIERAIGGAAVPVADGLGALINRLRAGADDALHPIIDRRTDRLVISLPRQESFPNGGAIPTTGARDLLARLAHAVEAGTWRIDVIGYGDPASTDRVERASAESLELSARRAQAVADALREAGCRGPIAVLGASAEGDTSSTSIAEGGSRQSSGLDIVIRGALRGRRNAA